MKALTLLFAIVVLAVSACQVSSPFSPSDQPGALQPADGGGGGCEPDSTPC